MKTNKREFTRVKVALHAELSVGGQVVVQGELRDISYKGLLLQCDVTLPEKTPCLVFVYLNGGQGGPVIEAKGEVKRGGSDHVAVQFSELIGQASAEHLGNLVLYNSGAQANQVEQELESHIGLHPKS